MSAAAVMNQTSAHANSAFNDLIDELTARLQAGETIDLDAVIAEQPEHADALRRLFPALHVLADLSRSGESTGAAPLDIGPFESAALGDFHIIREVGRGGMGVVYEATQVSLNRRVALKVLPFAATMDPRQLQRFRNEAQAAASLHHPNVVPVHGVGCDRGVHYYAMQLISGCSLAELNAEVKSEDQSNHDDTADTKVKSPTQRHSSLCSLSRRGRERFRFIAQFIAQAADALEYAHSMGVVHRDVKPANLMLDDAGHLWVTDFGLAKLGADAGVTMTGDLIGTLRYMSPEQALAKHGLVDHRTDVYSLGATLYELLTLQPAVDGDDKQEVLKKIAFEEPVALRKIDHSIPVELETITLKCLAKNPIERYATAGEVADDLRRWLGDQTIKAKPPGIRTRITKWARRHSGVLVTSIIGLGLFAISAVAGAAMVYWQKERTQTALTDAQDAYGLTKSALDDLTSNVVDEWLTRQAELTESQRQFLGRMRNHYERLATRKADDVESRGQLAFALNRVAILRRKLGDTAGAEDAYRRAGEILSAIVAAEKKGDRTCRPALAGNRLELGQTIAQNRPAEAISILREAAEKFEALDEAYSSKHGFRDHAAAAWVALGQAQMRAGVDVNGEESLRKALARWEAKGDEALARSSMDRFEYASALNQLGQICCDRSRFVEAERFLTKSAKVWEQLVVERPTDVSYCEGLLQAIMQVGAAQSKRGDSDAAIANYRRAIDLAQRLVDWHPKNHHRFRQKLVVNLNNLGARMHALRQFSEAEQLFRRSIAQQQVYFDLTRGPADGPYANPLGFSNLARVLNAAGKTGEAQTCLREAIEAQQSYCAYFPKDHFHLWWLARLLVQLANSHKQINQFAEAEKNYREAIGVCTAASLSDPLDHRIRVELADVHELFASCLTETNRLPEAIESLRKCIELRDALVRESPTDHGKRGSLALAYYNCANSLKNANKLADAEVAYRHAIDLLINVVELLPKHPLYRDALGRCQINLAASLKSTNHLSEAVEFYRAGLHSVDMLVRDFPNTPIYRENQAVGLTGMGRTMYLSGKHADARPYFRNSLVLCEQLIVEEPDNPRHQHNLAELLADCLDASIRDVKRAVVVAKQASELAPHDVHKACMLGLAYLRAEQWNEAIAVLEKATETTVGDDAYTRFQLAIAHWQIGHREKAADNFKLGIEWMTKHGPNDPELMRFHTEAASLLAISGGKGQ